jgi:hypothetical protein
VHVQRLTTGILVIGTLLYVGSAWAQTTSDDGATRWESRALPVRSTLTVTVVHAHNKKPGVDPKLKALSPYLQKSFASFTGFAQVGVHAATVPVDGEASFKLPDGKTLTLSFKGASKGFIKVYLELDGLKTTVDVRDGGLFFQAGRVYQDGILVLAIGAKT